MEEASKASSTRSSRSMRSTGFRVLRRVRRRLVSRQLAARRALRLQPALSWRRLGRRQLLSSFMRYACVRKNWNWRNRFRRRSEEAPLHPPSSFSARAPLVLFPEVSFYMALFCMSFLGFKNDRESSIKESFRHRAHHNFVTDNGNIRLWFVRDRFVIFPTGCGFCLHNMRRPMNVQKIVCIKL